MSHTDTDQWSLSTGPTILWTGSDSDQPSSDEIAEAGAQENVVTAAAADALELLRSDEQVDCVVCSTDSGIDPVAFVEGVRVLAPTLPVFVVTDEHDESVADRAYQAGVTDYLVDEHGESNREQMLDLFDQAAGRYHRSRSLRATAPSQESVIESVPDGIGVVREGSFVAGNRTLRDLVADGERAFADIEPCDVFDPELLSSVRGGGTVERQTEVLLARTGGPTVLADVTAVPSEWDDHPATLLVCRDRSRTATGSSQRLRQAIEAAGHAVYTTAPDGTIQYVNAAFEEITGYSAREVLGETPWRLNSGLMPEEYYRDLWNTVLSGETWQEVVANQRKDGSIYYADQTIAPILTGGDIQGFVAIQSDVTARKEIGDDLGAFKSIVERIEDPIMIQDVDGNFQVVNQAVSELAGLSKDELIGADEYAFMDETSARTVQEMKARALRQGEQVSYQITPTLPENEERTFSTVRYPEYDSDGEPVGTIAVCRDITEIKKHQRQFRVIERVLRHNLRNHIQVVRGVTEAISTESDDSDVQAYAEKVLESSDALLETADKERQITRFLSNETEVQQTDLVRVTTSAVDWARREFPSATITVDGPERCRVSAAGAIELAIRELVENAIVHSDRSAPSVEMTVAADDDSASVAVADVGPGIPEMERDVLSGRKSISPLHHGLGIGMWMVNLIVQESGGSLGFTENQPRGSVVTVTLPRPNTD